MSKTIKGMGGKGKKLVDDISVELGPQQEFNTAAADASVFETEPGKSASNLSTIGDDSLSTVLSFLSPSDIASCSAVCRHLRNFCKDDEKLWLPMCHRRWGAYTSVQKWGRRRVRFKLLYSILTKLENLVGFWRGVGQGGHGFLVCFEWGPHFVCGHRVMPSSLRTYGVKKAPFVWIGVSDFGRPVCFFYPRQHGVRTSLDAAEVSTSAQSAGGVDSPSRNAAESAEREKNPFLELRPDWDLERTNAPSGLLMVDLHFVGKFHIVMEELQRSQMVSNKSLTEAATIASFGSPGRRTADSSSPDSDKCGQSPPGSFQYEMFQFLSSKVASQGGERVLRRQRRREKERAVVLGRVTCEPEHFVKIRNVVPTSSRPLQGLWKGLCDSAGLNFLSVVYNDRGDILCRRFGECIGTMIQNSLNWTAEASAVVNDPLQEIEQDLFNCRRRICSALDLNLAKTSDDFDEQVVGFLRTYPIVRSDYGYLANADVREGLVWQYASGKFGFGSVDSDDIVDFRPLCSCEGLLLDNFE